MAGPQDAGDTVAIIGAGEMGSAIGRRLREMGAPVITEVRGRSAESVERVRRAGLKVIEDDNELVSEASFILSIVPPGVAVEVAERFRGQLLVGEFAFECKFKRGDDLHEKTLEKVKRFFVLLQDIAGDWISLGTTKTGIVYRLKGNPPRSHE